MEWFLLACLAVGAFVMIPAFRSLVGALIGLATIGFLVIVGLGLLALLLFAR